MVLTVIDWPIPGWMRYLWLVTLAFKSYQVCRFLNRQLDAGEDTSWLRSFPSVIVISSELIVSLSIIYALAIGLYAGAIFLLSGRILAGLGLVLLGTPLLVLIVAWLSAQISNSIDELFMNKVPTAIKERFLRPYRDDV